MKLCSSTLINWDFRNLSSTNFCPRRTCGDGSDLDFYRRKLVAVLGYALWVQPGLLHPEGSSQRQTVQFYLDSLVETGELRRLSDSTYELTGQAIKTVEDYEEHERKYGEGLSMQRRMVWLSFAIVLLAVVQAGIAVVQAGIVQLPLLIDLSSW